MSSLGRSQPTAPFSSRVDRERLTSDRSSAVDLDIQTTVTPEQLRDLMKKTDLRRLTNRMEELAEPATSSASTASDASGEPSQAATS